MTKDKTHSTTAKEKKKKVIVEVTEFIMTNNKGKDFKVVAPDESLDDDAKSALSGVYRIG